MKIFIILLCFMTAQVTAQQIEFVFPAKGQADISVTPTIEIKALGGLQIDSSSLKPDRPDRDNITYDTTTGEFSHAVIDIFMQDYYDGSDSSLFIASYVGAYGYGEYIDSVNYNVNFDRKLDYEYNYGISIRGLRLFNPITLDTFYLDTLIENYFETTLKKIEIKETNLYEPEKVKCSDTIFFEFTRKLTTLAPGGEELVKLYKSKDTTDSNGNGVVILDSITINSSFNEDSTRLNIKPDNELIADTKYRIFMNLGNYTGDTLDNSEFLFELNSVVHIRIESMELNGDTNIPNTLRPEIFSPNLYLKRGDSLKIYTELFINEHKFKKWEIIGESSGALISDSSIQTAVLTVDCATPYQLILNAVYEKIPLDTLKLDTIKTVTGAPVVGAFYKVHNYVDSLNEYTYTFKAYGEENELKICLNYNTLAYQFVEWEDAEEADDKNNGCIKINNGKYSNYTRPSTNLIAGGKVKDRVQSLCSDMTLTLRVVSNTNNIFQGSDHPANFLNQISLVANNQNIQITPSSFTKISNNVSEHQLLISKGAYNNFEYYISAEAISCYQLTAFSATNSPNAPTGLTGSRIDYKQFIKTMNNAQFEWDENIAPCAATITIYLDELKFIYELRLAVFEDEDFPMGDMLDFTLYNTDDEEVEPNILEEYLIKSENSPKQKVFILAMSCNETYKVSPLIRNDEKYILREWDVTNPYISSPLGNEPHDMTLTIEFDSDKKSRFYFQEAFMLKYLAIYDENYDNSQDRYKLNNYRLLSFVDEGSNIFPSKYLNTLYLHGTTGKKPFPQNNNYTYKLTELRLFFNRKLDTETLYSGNLKLQDKSTVLYEMSSNYSTVLRFDMKNPIMNYIGTDDVNDKSIDILTGFNGLTNSNETLKIISKSEENYGPTHESNLELIVSNNIKDEFGNHLKNPYSWEFKTSKGDFTFEVISYKGINFDELMDEYLMTMYSAFSLDKRIIVGGQSYQSDYKKRWPEFDDYHYMVKTIPETHIWDLSSPNMIYAKEIDEYSYIEITLHLNEIDGDCEICGHFLNLINSVAAGIKQQYPESWKIGHKWAVGIAEKIRKESGLNPDDFWGSTIYAIKPHQFIGLKWLPMYKWYIQEESGTNDGMENGQLKYRFMITGSL